MHGKPPPQTIDHPHESDPRRWRILAVLVLALLVTTIDHTIINVALPQLVSDLGASSAQLQWVVAGYTVVFAGLLLTAGSLGDRFGRRRALLIGLATFLAGSFGAALATSTGQLIGARCVMGAGGAFIMPTTLSILVNAFGEPRERAKAIATWSAVSGAGIALGPIIGGALMRSFSWSSVFWINVPLLVVALIGALHVVPESRDPHATRLDPVGALLSSVAVGSLVYAVIQGPEQGWGSAGTLATFGIGAVSGAAFMAWEARRHDPMLDLNLFRHRGFSVSSVTLAMLFFGMAGAVFLQAQYLQFILEYSPLVAGCALLPASLGVLLGTGAGAHLAATFGGRTAVASGTLLAAAGLAVQAAFTDGTSYAPIGIGLLLFALGAGIAMPSATDIIMATLPPARAGVGSAVNDTVRELGGALGVAVIGSVAATSYSSSLADGLSRFSDLSDPMRAAISDNVGAAIEMSQRLGTDGAAIASLAKAAFVDSMSGALWIAAASALGATILALFQLPNGSEQTTEHTPEEPQRSARRVALRAPAHVAAVAVAVVVLAMAAGCGDSTDPSASDEPANTSTTTPTTTTAPTVTTSLPRPSGDLDELVPVRDGARLHVRCTGEGDTTVVLIAGFEDAGDSWGSITPAVSEEARVCSYARFGLGTSDPPPSTQTFATEAEDLHVLLEAIGDPGPYVVVGHSYGGAQAVTFASVYAPEVSGLLLLDATPPTWPAAGCAVANDGSEMALSFVIACAMNADPANNSERLDTHRAFAEVAEITALGDLPMIVATASDRPYTGLPDEEAERLREVWNTGQETWVSLSSAAQLVSVGDSGHHIEVDQPGVVIEQIRHLLG